MKFVNLEKIATVKLGLSRNYSSKRSDQLTESCGLIGIENIDVCCLKGAYSTVWVKPQAVERYGVQINDILLPKVFNKGYRAGLVTTGGLPGQPLIPKESCILIRLNPKAGISPLFLVIALNNPPIADTLKNKLKVAKGNKWGNTGTLSVEDVKQVRIAIPDIQEQQSIIDRWLQLKQKQEEYLQQVQNAEASLHSAIDELYSLDRLNEDP